MAKFSNKLKELRESKGWTQAELAKRLGVSRSTIGMYEQGNREPDFDTLEKIADFFNVDMSVFLEGQQSDCDLYLQCYDKQVYQIVHKLLKLDTYDLGRVEGYIDDILKGSKYQEIKSKGDSDTIASAI